MKELFFLSLFLTTTLSQPAYACSYADDEYMENKKKQCLENPSKDWSCELSRCIEKEIVDEIGNAMSSCDDITNEEQKSKCRVDAAKEAVEKEKDIDLDKKVKGSGEFAGHTFQSLAAVHALLSFANRKYKNCTETSLKIMGAAGIASTISMILSYRSLKKESNKIESKYKSIIGNADEDPQKLAFDALAAEQDIIGDNLKKQATNNKVVGGLYAAAAIASAYEIYSTRSPSKSECVKEPPKTQTAFKEFRDGELYEQGSFTKPTGPADVYYKPKPPFQYKHLPLIDNDGFLNIEDIIIVNEKISLLNNLFIKEAHATDLISLGKSTVTGAATIGVIAKAAEHFELDLFLEWPATRLVTSSLASALSFKMANSYEKAADRAFAKADAVREIGESFVVGEGLHCGDRKDRNKPECYCYTAEGKRDQNKTNSQTCQNYWPGGANPFAPATAYGVGSSSGVNNEYGCMNRQGQYDGLCTCKNQTWSNGANNCVQKQTSSFGSYIPPSLQTSTGSLYNTAMAMGNGELGSGSVNAAAAGQAALALQKAQDKVIKNLNKKLISQGKKPIPYGAEANNKLLSKIMKKTPKGFNSVPKNMNVLSTSNLADKSATGGKKDKKISGLLAKAASRTGITGASSIGKKNTPNFDLFGDMNNNTAKTGLTFEGAPSDTEYKIKQNEIVRRPQTPIWKIISNRYHLSGYERLFGEK